MPEHRETEIYEHFAPRLIEEADPLGAYLLAQTQTKFNELFPRCSVLPDSASERPALASVSNTEPSPASVGHDSQKPMEQV